MAEEERHAFFENAKGVAVLLAVVDKLRLVDTLEAGQPDLTLRVASRLA